MVQRFRGINIMGGKSRQAQLLGEFSDGGWPGLAATASRPVGLSYNGCKLMQTLGQLRKTPRRDNV